MDRLARRFRIASLVTVVAALGATGAPSAGAGARDNLVPASGVLFGAWVNLDDRWTNNRDAEAEVRTFEDQIGRKLAIDHHYYAWTDRFPSGLEQWDLANGRIPLISWKATTLREINHGRFDGMIRARADAVRQLGQPVFLRFAWEMNGRWEAWSGARNGGPRGPDRYVSAWRRVHSIFDAAGATNVVWVWSPGHQDAPAAAWNHWTNYYPGDAWVDWVGVDGFNWGESTRWGHRASFGSLVHPVYRDYASRKPIMVAETGSAEQGGNKPQWYVSARDYIERVLPDVKAVVYFHAHDHAYVTDWRITTSPVAGSAFRTWAHDPYFDTGSQGERRLVSGAFVWPRKIEDTTQVAFTLSGPADVSIEIRDGAGDVVRHLLSGVTYDAHGSYAVTWDRTDDNGNRVPPAWYTAVVTGQDRSATPIATRNESWCSFEAL
jgi:endoglucanase